jgi:hypothetical protein
MRGIEVTQLKKQRAYQFLNNGHRELGEGRSGKIVTGYEKSRNIQNLPTEHGQQRNKRDYLFDTNRTQPR